MMLPISLISTLNAKDEKTIVVKVPLKVGPNVKVNRSVVPEAIECYFYRDLNLVQTNVYSDVGVVSYSIINMATGSAWNGMFDSALLVHDSVLISAEPGFYEVTYIIESGVVYEGYFTIE